VTRRIVLLDVTPADRLARLRALLPAGFALDGGVAPGVPAMEALIADADFAITGQVAVPASVLAAGRKLQLLHKWGVGVDNIDLDAARRLGVAVARTTGSNALPVAEFTIGLMLSALRMIPYGHRWLSQGSWRGPSALPAEPLLLSGRTVGIVGLGAIGKEVARLIRGFGCRVLYMKRGRLPAEEEARLGVEYAGLDRILAESDVVSLHCPLTSETAGLIGRDAFDRMKPSAILINVARGGVVDEAALHEALSKRRIRGAAMDVFSLEPAAADNPLLALDTIVVTPHLAAVTADTFEPTVRRMFRNIALAAAGEPIPETDRVV
jgi:phosphoglycerate dehydrogenase-like enzyme